MRGLARQCRSQGKVLAAICHVPWVLIAAGIMAGLGSGGTTASTGSMKPGPHEDDPFLPPEVYLLL
jgi:hypothetical protein